jgi:DNA-binding MarR family transcriptional regulator
MYPRDVGKKQELKARATEVAHTCACQGVRRSARAITHVYDRTLSPLGVKATQLPILVALEVAGPVPLTPLAEGLVMDRTTLTRNLRALQEQNLVRVKPGSDRRVKLLALTEQGRELLDEALDLWESAQGQVKQSFGEERLVGLLDELSHLTDAVRS